MAANPIKFVVVLVRRPGMSVAEFRDYFKTVHEPLALAIPHLCGYIQNFATDGPARPRPGWDAVIELRFTSAAAMEEAWASEAGAKATDDLQHFADLARSAWGIVDEHVLR